jgi:hypothetical protein
MESFFIGLHHPSVAWPFQRAMISVNSLKNRIGPFRVNDWILDSGSFSQIKDSGRHTLSAQEYLGKIEQFSKCGRLLAAVCQDWMCEPFILEKTGLSVGGHQERTIQSYLELKAQAPVPILPVLQGFRPREYVSHVRAYGNLLFQGAWVGVGSVCNRNGNQDAIEDVLLAIKAERGDLRLHGFGLKLNALERPTVRALLYSSDSLAWSDAARKEERASNDPREALAYCARVQEVIERPVFIQEQLFGWWTDEKAQT